jgi:hypothetical protein
MGRGGKLFKTAKEVVKSPFSSSQPPLLFGELGLTNCYATISNNDSSI